MSDEEVIYEFIRGQGWVPKLKQESPFSWKALDVEEYRIAGDAWVRRLREWQEERSRWRRRTR